MKHAQQFSTNIAMKYKSNKTDSYVRVSPDKIGFLKRFLNWLIKGAEKSAKEKGPCPT